MGTPTFSVPILEALAESYSVVLVVTQPDKPVGRKQIITPSPIKVASSAYNLPIFQPVSIKNEFQTILDLHPDLIITCAYGQFLPKKLLECPKYGSINVHASLLPKYRGGAPIHKAIINGEGKTGVTIMKMNEKMDAGDILSQREVIIEEEDDKGSLSEKLSQAGKDLLLETIPKIISNKIEPIPQKEKEASYAYTIQKEEEHLDFSKSTRQLYDQIRGMYPEPIAYAMLDGKRLKIYKARMEDHVYMDKKDGEIVQIYKDGIGVSTKDGELILEQIQLEGKTKCFVHDFLNGTKEEDLLGHLLK